MADVRSFTLCSMIETLEGRQLLSVAPVSLRGGNLMVHGTSGNDTIEFIVVATQPTQDPQTPQDPEVPADSPAPAATPTPTAEPAFKLKVVFNGQERTLDMAKVKRIFVNAGRGDDKITFDESAGALTYAKSQLIGGQGNDTILGGSGKDCIFGNAGNDSLVGNGGNDWINGGAGDDDLAGNDGTDVLVGESGNDDFVGNDGSREVKDKNAADTGDNVLSAKKVAKKGARRARVFD